MSRRVDPVGDLLVIIHLTELRERVPARGLELWALDCARRALGADVPGISAMDRSDLRGLLDHARRWLRAPDDELLAEAVEHASFAMGLVRDNFRPNPSPREVAVWDAIELAVACVSGEPHYEDLAQAAQRAFVTKHRYAENEAQARRLLLRSKLMPSGAELLVRLDYAESRGLLPQDAASRAWLDRHQALLMAEDEDSRFAVTLRYLDEVFEAELDSA